MKKQFLEAGKIVNTHGIRGEVKIQPWADDPEFLTGFKTLYIDGAACRVLSSRVHKDFVLVQFEGVTDIDSAVRFKNRVVSINRDDAHLPEGKHFIEDMVGVTAVDAETGAELGKVQEILPLPAGTVYVIRGEREILIPDVPEFIKEADPDAGIMRVKTIEGM